MDDEKYINYHIYTEEEAKNHPLIIARDRLIKKRSERKESFLRFLCFVVCSPISIAFKGLAFITKLVSVLLSIGLPYGAYCAYRVVRDMMNGVDLFEASHFKGLLIFMAFPFLGFALSYLFIAISSKAEEML